MGLEDDKNYFSLMSEVVKWNNLYHDELIYSLGKPSNRLNFI